MKEFATMNDMEDYIGTGKDNFIKLLGKRTMAFKDFVDELEEVDQIFTNFPKDKLMTKGGQQIIEKLNTLWAVSILVMSNDSFLKQGNLKPLTSELVEFLYENYNKEMALNTFNSFGYKQYLLQKVQNKMFENEDQKQSQEENSYNNGNYTNLE